MNAAEPANQIENVEAEKLRLEIAQLNKPASTSYSDRQHGSNQACNGRQAEGEVCPENAEMVDPCPRTSETIHRKGKTTAKRAGALTEAVESRRLNS